MEAKYRLQTNDENWHQIWKEDGEGRELPYCEIVNTDKETVAEVFRAVNTFDQAREALNHLLYANHKPCLGCDGCNNARKTLAAMEATS